jgi:hypothetical protein
MIDLETDHDVCLMRRGLLLAPLFAALPFAASAAKIDPGETVITLPDAFRWMAWNRLPPQSGEMATLYGGLDQPGPYLVLMKWYPGPTGSPSSYRAFGG